MLSLVSPDDVYVKSRDRVRDLGEVYTRPREVQAMLDLIPADVHAELTSRWLEPACGNGNFLVAIIERKLALVDYETLSRAVADRYLVTALAHVYGIDIDYSNVIEARERLYSLVVDYRALFGISTRYTSNLARSIRHVLHTTIVVGNTLLPDDTSYDVAEYTVTGARITSRLLTLRDALSPDGGEVDDFFDAVDFGPDPTTAAYDALHTECVICS